MVANRNLNKRLRHSQYCEMLLSILATHLIFAQNYSASRANNNKEKALRAFFSDKLLCSQCHGMNNACKHSADHNTAEWNMHFWHMP